MQLRSSKGIESARTKLSRLALFAMAVWVLFLFVFLPPPMPTDCWIIEIQGPPPQPWEESIEAAIYVKLAFQGPAPDLAAARRLFQAELVCDGTDKPPPISEDALSQTIVFNKAESTFDVNLRLSIEAPLDLGAVACRLISTTPTIRDESVVVRLRPLRDHRGQVLPFGASDRIDNRRLTDSVSEVSLRDDFAGNKAKDTGMLFSQGKISADGRRIALAGTNTAYLWDTETRQATHAFSHPRIIADIAFSPDSRRLAISSGEDVTVVDVDGSIRSRLAGRADRVTFSRDGRKLYGMHRVKIGIDISVWDVGSGERTRNQPMGVDKWYRMSLGAWVSSRDAVAYSDKRNSVRLRGIAGHPGLPQHKVASRPWESRGRRVVTSNEISVTRVADLGGNRVAVLRGNGEIAIWDLESNESHWVGNVPCHKTFTVLTGAQNFVAVAGANGIFWLVDSQSGEIAFESPDGSGVAEGQWADTQDLSVSQDGRMLEVKRRSDGTETGCEAVLWDLSRIRNLVAQARGEE